MRTEPAGIEDFPVADAEISAEKQALPEGNNNGLDSYFWGMSSIRQSVLMLSLLKQTRSRITL